MIASKQSKEKEKNDKLEKEGNSGTHDNEYNGQKKLTDNKFVNFALHAFDRKQVLSGENEQKWWQIAIDLFLCNIVRMVFIDEGIFMIYYVVGITNNYYYIFSIIPLILIILDGLYVSVCRLGKENSW
jgi:hypothetical protein